MGEALIVRRGGGSSVKGVQYLQAAMTGSTTTLTIDPIDLNAAVPIVIGYPQDNPNSTFPNVYTATTEFASETALKLSRTVSSGVGQFYISVIEFKNVKSLQYVKLTLSETYKVIDIDAVNVQKSMLIINKAGASGVGCKFQGNSQIVFYSGSSVGLKHDVSLYVVEFN